MDRIARRRVLAGSWSAPLIVATTAIPVYAVSPENKEQQGTAWSFQTPASSMTLADGSKPNKTIHSIALTRRGTLVPAYGDYDKNSDTNAPGTQRVVLQEYDMVTGQVVGEAFAVGSEALHYFTEDSDGVIYFTTTDPSGKPATGQMFGNVAGIIHDTTGGWELYPIGGSFAHVFGIAVTEDKTIFVGTGGWDGRGSIYRGRIGGEFTEYLSFPGNQWGRVYDVWVNGEGTELVFRLQSVAGKANGYYWHREGQDLKMVSGDVAQVWWDSNNELHVLYTDGRVMNESTRQVRATLPAGYHYLTPHIQGTATVHALGGPKQGVLYAYNKVTNTYAQVSVASKVGYFSRALAYRNGVVYTGGVDGEVHVEFLGDI